MDDFDYSVQISELDWNTFFQECEECDLLPPALAGLEDSGMSDADDASSSLSSRDPHAALDTDLLEPDDPIDGLPDSEGCPVENYFSACDLPCPEDVLSCSEEDRHLESVNVFFERLKSMTEGGSFHAEAKPKGTGQGEEPAKHPAHPIGLSESKCSTDNRQRLTGAESTGSEQEDEEPVASAKPLEVEKAPDSPCPVYAMSSFWQEMEKLTINDILRLRLVGNAQTPGGLLRPQDASTADPSEAGDSGYSSHLEDSKPDRSSGDISTISDFEEECLPSHSASVNPSPEPQDTERQGQRSLGSSSSRGVLWESEPDPISTGVDNGLEGAATLHAEDANPTLFRSSSAKQGFRRMCKNISVQNLRALETEPHVNQASRNASPCTIVMEEEESKEYKGTYYESKETCNSVPLESRSNAEASATSSLPEDVFTGGYVFSFPEIFEYLFGADETKTGHTDAACTDLPVCNEGSVPEMYDHFFSEFETGNFFLPLIQGSDKSQSEPVPIFSCSRFSKRNMQFPEAYDYFFPDDSPVESSEDEDDHSHDRAPIRVVTRFDKVANTPQGAAAAPDMYEHFFADNDCRDNLFWRNPLSLRRLFFGGLTGSKQMSPPFALQPTDYQRNTVLSTIYPDSAVGNPGPASPQSPLYCLEERIFRELAEQQMRYGDLQNAVAIARPDSSLLSLKQSDMCLICIAFASWVLKTANPQDADTWKAALLANISALSAIRYLRRYIREESTTKKP
ncbi:hypothetical protein MATL_G00112200 [Megalops atlanticus]|uniref:PGC-1 and ERR-induced regulator in muscle protein 1 n=1 Tax=Megalops atlanticus TaxID=7932 RepID=A0A9D3Q004_MEGAT|nr:hypothetical protein MATL_G00112200 [Megalops atlanticus]